MALRPAGRRPTTRPAQVERRSLDLAVAALGSPPAQPWVRRTVLVDPLKRGDLRTEESNAYYFQRPGNAGAIERSRGGGHGGRGVEPWWIEGELRRAAP